MPGVAVMQDGREADGRGGQGETASELFVLLWNALTEMMGSPAAATLIRRAAKRARSSSARLEGFSISMVRFDYQYTLPASWAGTSEDSLDALRALTSELQPILAELTGPVVLRRLRGIPEVERRGLFPDEGER